MDGVVAERGPDPETDEHGWLLQQAAALRAHRLNALDLDNLAEYLEAMARSEVREVAARLRILFAHMLKFEFQPDRAGRSWALSVLNAQNELLGLLESPTLRREAEAMMPKVWERACKLAATETGLPPSSFPRRNPWSLDQALAWEPPGGQPTLRPRPKKR
jgi:hypothetical protein